MVTEPVEAKLMPSTSSDTVFQKSVELISQLSVIIMHKVLRKSYGVLGIRGVLVM